MMIIKTSGETAHHNLAAQTNHSNQNSEMNLLHHFQQYVVDDESVSLQNWVVKAQRWLIQHIWLAAAFIISPEMCVIGYEVIFLLDNQSDLNAMPQSDALLILASNFICDGSSSPV